MSITNVTPRPQTPAGNRRVLIAALVVIALVILFRMLFSHHENRYEVLASEVTTALANNDLAAVEKYQNAETATHITRGLVGRAADALAPLGKVKDVREDTPAGDGDRVHEFNVTFEHGAMHEKMKVDPDDKVVTFHYDDPVPTK
jgi:hypothetical protein